jgi:signal recognition particle subunit SRP54
MFDALQSNLSQAFRRLTGQARLTEANMREGLKQVERALLEADVNIKVVREFMDRVTTQAVGEEVLKSLKPTDHVINIVYNELVNLMGPVDHSLHLRDLTKIMLCGLQGSGKTTTCAKLARLLKQNGRRPMMVAADLQRPAAIHQLQVLGEQIGVPVHADTSATDPVKLCQDALRLAPQQNVDVVLFDTAGRLHIDQELMDQLKRVDNKVEPHQVYLVVDGMTGQDAVNSAKAFNEALELNGVIMTKLDGDARGGAVLSVKAVTGVPIKFLGIGEHLQDLEPFRPEGMASRILGGGDLLEVARRAQTEMDQEQLAEQQRRMMEGQFTLDDFLSTLGQIKKLGRLSGILKYLPGFGQMKDMLANVDVDKDLTRVQGMIHSMTPDERRNPGKLIDQSRRRRIAAGSGVQPHEVNDLVKQFDVMADMMKRFAGKGMRGQMEAMQEIQRQAADPRGPSKQKIGTGKRLSTAERERLRKQKEKELRRKRREERKQ